MEQAFFTSLVSVLTTSASWLVGCRSEGDSLAVRYNPLFGYLSFSLPQNDTHIKHVRLSSWNLTVIPTIKDSLRDATEEDIHPDGRAGAEGGGGISCSASTEEVTATGREAWNAKARVC